MKKLLLGLIASLALISTTLYAACTANVDMGNFKIENVASGTNSGDAVNYGQTLQMTSADVNETNTSILDGGITVRKRGGICIMYGTINNTSGAVLSSPTIYGKIDESGFRPTISKWYANGGLDVVQGTWTFFADILIETNGRITLQGDRNSLPAGKSVVVNATYICN